MPNLDLFFDSSALVAGIVSRKAQHGHCC